MTQQNVELARIKLGPGKTEKDLLAASEAFQREFLNRQPGFICRDLLRVNDGEYIELVRWKD